MKRYWLFLLLGLACLILLSSLSLFIGATDIHFWDLFASSHQRDIFLLSRIPRTMALLLVGSTMSVAGLMMQLLTQNRFVEPSLAGTTQSATLGILISLVFFPMASIAVKMGIAIIFAFVGTLIFLFLIRKIMLKSALIVPIIGMMLSAVVGAITTFCALYFELLQSLGAWLNGDFSHILKGRYELLWILLGITVLAYFIADRFTIAGMGQDFSKNVGLNYQQTMVIGLSMIAIISGIVIVTVGTLPFIGLIVPNMVSLILGDNLRKSLPWIALIGAMLVISCDIIGRVIIYPYEMPVSLVLSVVGAIFFLFLLLRGKNAKR